MIILENIQNKGHITVTEMVFERRQCPLSMVTSAI